MTSEFEPIGDCAATDNDHDGWVSYYPSYPLVRVRDGQATFWHSMSHPSP